MEETEKLRAISEIAALLRETTRSKFIFNDNTSDIETSFGNTIFTQEEHSTVKRKFLHLLNSL